MHLNINTHLLIHLATLAVLLSGTLVQAKPLLSRKPPVTVLTSEDQLLDEYDYIVVGGGTAGLVVANRLSEDADVTVLILEAGPYIPDPLPIWLQGPNYAFRSDKIGPYIFPIWPSEPNKELLNRTAVMVAARIIGGGSAINGMFFDRGGGKDYDAWEKLGNKGWGWRGIKKYFIKSETFTPPTEKQVKELGITWDPEAHGKSGPIHSSYPPVIYTYQKTMNEAIKSLGVPSSRDQAANAVGVLWVPNALDPANMTRSYSHTGYLQPIINKRLNLHLLANRSVLKILTTPSPGDEGPIVTGVEFGQSKEAKRFTVKGKGVVLATGALHTPQILQLSGFGDRALLSSKGIKTVMHLPGVGENFQDHAFIRVPYNLSGLTNDQTGSLMSTNETYRQEMLDLYTRTRTGPFTVSLGNSGSFVPLPFIASPDQTQSFIGSLLSVPASTYLDPTAPKTYQKGFERQRSVLAKDLASKDAAFFKANEGLFSIQKPFSRGHVRIKSSDPWERPSVNYRTLSDPTDLNFLLHGLDFIRRIYSTPAIAPANPIDVSVYAGIPVNGTSADREKLKTLIRENIVVSMVHPCCTAPMMELKDGGVVDGGLRVHGTKGLWVVDASIMPLIPAAHLSATVYAAAEKAADLIKNK